MENTDVKIVEEDRRTYLSPSQMAAFFRTTDGPEGRTLHPYLEPSTLIYEKTGRIPVDSTDNIRAMCGRYMEPAIYEMIRSEYCIYAPEDKKPFKKIRKGRFKVHPKLDRFAGTNDGFIFSNEEGNPYEHILEIKTVDRDVWYHHYRDTVPAHWIVQLNGYMILHDKMRGVLAVLVGGNDLRFFYYKYDPDLCKAIKMHIADFWKFVDSGEEYVPPEDVRYDHMWLRYCRPSEDFVERYDPELDELCHHIRAIRQQTSELEKQKEELRHKIVYKMGGHRRVETPNYVINLSETKGGNQLRVSNNKKARQDITPAREEVLMNNN